jgi:hypothetical protein
MTQDPGLPDIALAEWRDTRDTLHQYARLAGKIRAAMTPRHKHWRHITLHTGATGLTTTPMPANVKVLELLLDCTRHCFTLTSSYGEEQSVQLQGRSIRGVRDDLVAALSRMGASPTFDRDAFSDATPLAYDTDAATRFWRAFAWIDGVFKRFKGGLREESGPVHVFPHHFDLSVKWFSGRLVPGADKADEESADELMTFGFHTGDASVPDAYFYITAYPLPQELVDMSLPTGAYWHTEGFSGAVMRYETVRAAADPAAALLNFLRNVQAAGARAMQD